MINFFTFSYEHIDGYHGLYVRAESRDEADKLFAQRELREGTVHDDYHLVRIQWGNSDGPWLWDLFRDIRDPLPDLTDVHGIEDRWAQATYDASKASLKTDNPDWSEETLVSYARQNVIDTYCEIGGVWQGFGLNHRF